MQPVSPSRRPSRSQPSSAPASPAAATSPCPDHFRRPRRPFCLLPSPSSCSSSSRSDSPSSSFSPSTPVISMPWPHPSRVPALAFLLFALFLVLLIPPASASATSMDSSRTDRGGEEPLAHIISRYLDTPGMHDRYRAVLGLSPGVYYHPLYFYSRADATFPDTTTTSTPPPVSTDLDILRLFNIPIPGVDDLLPTAHQVEGGSGSDEDGVSPLRCSSVGRIANGTKSNFALFYSPNTPLIVKEVMLSTSLLWANQFQSAATIRVCLIWDKLAEGTLGATTTNVFVDGTEYSRLKNGVMFTPALGSAIQGRDLLGAGKFHVNIVLNNLINWHYNKGSSATMDRFDLATTILHELTHGLFFTGSIRVIPGGATVRKASFRRGTPARFDQFLRVEGNISVAQSCNENNDTAEENLYNAIRSPNLQIIGRRNNRFYEMGLHGPRVYASGSSVYHFNNLTIKDDCAKSGIPASSADCSDLMTHELKMGYTNRNLGDTTLGVYELMRSAQDGVQENAPCVVKDYQPNSSEAATSAEKDPENFTISSWGILVVSVVGAIGVILVLGVVVNTVISRR